MLQALELHASTLSNLQVTFDDGDYWFYVSDPSSGLDFSAFGVLEHLKINWSLLIGDGRSRRPVDLSARTAEYARIRQRLPGSLRRLTLTTMISEGPNKSNRALLAYVLDQIMQEKTTSWPHLEHISVFTHLRNASKICFSTTSCSAAIITVSICRCFVRPRKFPRRWGGAWRESMLRKRCP